MPDLSVSPTGVSSITVVPFLSPGRSGEIIHDYVVGRCRPILYPFGFEGKEEIALSGRVRGAQRVMHDEYHTLTFTSTREIAPVGGSV